MKFRIHKPQAIWEIGQRENQEDYIYPQKERASEKDRVFVLCDGMGGHSHGEVASKTICEAIASYLHSHASADQPLSDATFQAALDYAYKELDQKDDGAFRRMGTTLTFLCLHRGGATMAHIGDSRIYHIRGSKKRLLYQSRDHSLVFDLYQSGEISYEQMRTSPQKNVINRAMLPGEENRVKADIVHTTDIQPGDYFYLCSDGMLEQMENAELVRLLCDEMSDEEKAQMLISETTGNRDNHSAIIVHVAQAEPESADEQQPNDEGTTRYNALNIHPKRTAAPADPTDCDDDVSLAEPPKAAFAPQRDGMTQMAQPKPAKRPAAEPAPKPAQPAAAPRQATDEEDVTVVAQPKAAQQATAAKAPESAPATAPEAGKKSTIWWILLLVLALLAALAFGYFHFFQPSDTQAPAEPAAAAVVPNAEN